MRFLTIDEPNADKMDTNRGTTIQAINNSGEMVGGYDTTIDTFGFEDIGGSFGTLAGPLIAIGRSAFGVNDLDQVVGTYDDNLFHTFGFLLNGASYTTLNDPKANNFTAAQGINDAGQVVGYYFDAGAKFHGFEYSGGVNGTYTDIDIPGAFFVAPSAINASGEIVGSYQDGNGHNHGFVDISGSFTTLDDPLGVKGTQADGVNDHGQIVGIYYDANNFSHGYRYSNGVYTTIDVPNAISTQLFGINNAGQIVGRYNDGVSNHGILLTPVVSNDFDGNGMSNLLWRSASGALADWSMNGSMISGSSTFAYQGNQIAPDASWSIAATSDFNGDGAVDVLWRQNTGSLALWQMNGASISSSSPITYQGNVLTPDSSWSIAGTADFNGDGNADMLWRQSSGALALWTMNGSTVTSSATVTYQGNAIAPDASWSVAGIGDFNGDGSADMLWRQSSGTLAMWTMNGPVVSSSSALTFQGSTLTPDASWSVAGVGDFNGDGSADMLWRQSSGALAIWTMNGSTVQSSAAITYQGNAVAPDASWKVVEIGDFNGDGRSDILWRNDDGSMSEWLMNGSQIMQSLTPSSQGNPAAPDSSWTVQARPINFG
jgi:probable HAF family extracellular repeat protein